jgi:hypothetical protein
MPMKALATIAIACMGFVLSKSSVAEDKPSEDSAPRNDLYHANLSDGSFLNIRAIVESLDKPQVARVSFIRHRKGAGTQNDKEPAHWWIDLTSVEYAPNGGPCYALVRAYRDRIAVYTMWNNQHFVVDTATGRVTDKGNGDDVLKESSSFIPLKLKLVPPATGRVMTEQEVKEFDERQRSDSGRIGGK